MTDKEFIERETRVFAGALREALGPKPRVWPWIASLAVLALVYWAFA